MVVNLVFPTGQVPLYVGCVTASETVEIAVARHHVDDRSGLDILLGREQTLPTGSGPLCATLACVLESDR